MKHWSNLKEDQETKLLKKNQTKTKKSQTPV